MALLQNEHTSSRIKKHSEQTTLLEVVANLALFLTSSADQQAARSDGEAQTTSLSHGQKPRPQYSLEQVMHVRNADVQVP